MNPLDPVAWSLIGHANAELGRNAEAVEAYRRVLRLVKRPYAPVHFWLGKVYEGQHSQRDAMQSYREAIRIDPLLLQAHFNLGNLLYADGDFKGAIEAFRHAVDLDRKSPDGYVRLGDSIMSRVQGGRLETARFEKNETTGSRDKRRNAHEESTGLQQAAQAYERAIAIQPLNVKAHFGLGLAYAALDRRALAMAEYDSVKSLDEGLAGKLLRSFTRQSMKVEDMHRP